MKFSILIAHYNNHIYFVDCYKSIQNQSFEDFEIVILDDGSSTESFETLKEITKDDPRVKLFKNTENKGVGYTKKRLVELAAGEMCAFVDPDDAITFDAVKTCVNALNADPDTIGVYSQLYWCDKNLIPEKVFISTRKIKNNDAFFFNLKSEVAHLFTFKKSAYLKTPGINENLSSAVDMDLYMKLYEIGGFRYIPEPLYLYRVHEEGVSQNTEKKAKLNDNWNTVLFNTVKRRKIERLYGKKPADIQYFPEFIFKKQNTLLKRLVRKFSW